MAFVEADLERMDRAIGQSVLKVTFADGREVTFSTFEELVARRNFIARSLGLQAGRERMFSEFRKGVSC